MLNQSEQVFTHRERKTLYKIDPINGTYGGVLIDLPKLYGLLKLIAYKDCQNVCDKQVDFDTLDFFTERFNSNKKYNNMAKTVFDHLTGRLSEIPIHSGTSKKYKKIGSAVIYYNNPKDLLDRL